MEAIFLVLLIVAAVCFALAAFNTAARVNLVALGLFAWILIPLIKAIQSIQ